MPQLFMRKDVRVLREEGEVHNLPRVLSARQLTALGVGAVIGAGIFVLTGQAAAAYAGPAIVLSFALAGFVCAMAALCYAEMASSVPTSGSAYTFAYATLGEFVAWLIGWDLILEYALSATTVAIGWSGYVVSLLRGLGVYIPAQFTAAPGTRLVEIPEALARRLHMMPGWAELANVRELLAAARVDAGGLSQCTAVFNAPAMLVTAAVTLLLIGGVRESVRLNYVIVVIKVGAVLTFIAVGAWFFSTAHWGGKFLPANTGEFGRYGWSGVLRGAGVAFFAFLGFDAVAATAAEAKNPQRDMPRGILASLAICTVLYMLVSFVLTGVVDYRRLAVPDPIAVGIDAMGLAWLSPIIKLGAIAGLTSVILVALMSQSRIVFSMAGDGLIPPGVARLHPRFRTPHRATFITGTAVAVAAGVMPLAVAGELVSIGALFAFVVVCLGVLVSRVTHPGLDRPFRTPAVWVTAPLGVASSLLLMAGLESGAWIRLIVWMAIGVTFYGMYGARHSHLRRGTDASGEERAVRFNEGDEG